MTDKLIEQIKEERNCGDFLDKDTLVNPEYLNALEARILADAKVIEAAKELAAVLEGEMACDAAQHSVQVEDAFATFNEALKGEE